MIRLLTRNANGYENAPQVSQSLIGYCTRMLDSSTTAPMAETAHNRARTVSGAKVGAGAAGMAGQQQSWTALIIRASPRMGYCGFWSDFTVLTAVITD